VLQFSEVGLELGLDVGIEHVFLGSSY
jgi:hypothetical protein